MLNMPQMQFYYRGYVVEDYVVLSPLGDCTQSEPVFVRLNNPTGSLRIVHITQERGYNSFAIPATDGFQWFPVAMKYTVPVCDIVAELAVSGVEFAEMVFRCSGGVCETR